LLKFVKVKSRVSCPLFTVPFLITTIPDILIPITALSDKFIYISIFCHSRESGNLFR